MTAGQGLGLGFLLSALNPKNLLMGVGAGVAIGCRRPERRRRPPSPSSIFTVLAGCTVAVPVIAYLVAADKMAGPLETLRTWLVHNNATVMSRAAARHRRRDDRQGHRQLLVLAVQFSGAHKEATATAACEIPVGVRISHAHRDSPRPEWRRLPRRDVAELPAAVEVGLERSVEAEVGEPVLARDGLHPVGASPVRGVGPEEQVDRAVVVGDEVRVA